MFQPVLIRDPRFHSSTVKGIILVRMWGYNCVRDWSGWRVGAQSDIDVQCRMLICRMWNVECKALRGHTRGEHWRRYWVVFIGVTLVCKRVRYLTVWLPANCHCLVGFLNCQIYCRIYLPWIQFRFHWRSIHFIHVFSSLIINSFVSYIVYSFNWYVISICVKITSTLKTNFMKNIWTKI